MLIVLALACGGPPPVVMSAEIKNLFTIGENRTRRWIATVQLENGAVLHLTYGHERPTGFWLEREIDVQTCAGLPSIN